MSQVAGESGLPLRVSEASILVHELMRVYAVFLDLVVHDLQTLRSNGTLPYSRINNKIYYRRHDIQQILADNYKMNTIRYDYGKKRQ